MIFSNLIFRIVLGMIQVWRPWKLFIFQDPHLLCPSTSKILPPPLINSLQMITNHLKENIIQGWLLYVIRTFLQVGFRCQYQTINLVWLFFDFFSFSWSHTFISPSSWLYTLVCAVVKKYQEMSFVYNYSQSTCFICTT